MDSILLCLLPSFLLVFFCECFFLELYYIAYIIYALPFIYVNFFFKISIDLFLLHCVCLYVCLCMSLCVYVFICVHICVHTYIYTYKYTYIYIHVVVR